MGTPQWHSTNVVMYLTFDQCCQISEVPLVVPATEWYSRQRLRWHYVVSLLHILGLVRRDHDDDRQQLACWKVHHGHCGWWLRHLIICSSHTRCPSTSPLVFVNTIPVVHVRMTSKLNVTLGFTKKSLKSNGFQWRLLLSLTGSQILRNSQVLQPAR